jgi:predicted XRE-type DNA-binding protein
MNQRPDTEQIKADLAAAIVRLLAERTVSEATTSEQTGIAVADLALIREGKFGRLTVDRLIEILNAFDQRVEVKVSPVAAGPLLRILEYMTELDAKIRPQNMTRFRRTWPKIWTIICMVPRRRIDARNFCRCWLLGCNRQYERSPAYEGGRSGRAG